MMLTPDHRLMKPRPQVDDELDGMAKIFCTCISRVPALGSLCMMDPSATKC